MLIGSGRGQGHSSHHRARAIWLERSG